MAMCPSSNGEDFTIVLAICPTPSNGNDSGNDIFFLVAQVSKVEIFRVLLLRF